MVKKKNQQSNCSFSRRLHWQKESPKKGLRNQKGDNKMQMMAAPAYPSRSMLEHRRIIRTINETNFIDCDTHLCYYCGQDWGRNRLLSFVCQGPHE